MSQSALGIVLLPPVSYGPCTLSLTGPLSSFTPSSLSVISRSIRALLIGVEKALSRVSVTLPESPPPQALRTAARSATTRSGKVRMVRDIGGQPSPPPLKSAPLWPPARSSTRARAASARRASLPPPPAVVHVAECAR